MTKPLPKATIGKHSGIGRTATGDDQVTQLRLTGDLCKGIDTWAGRQRDTPARAEAIRRLIVIGLKTERSKRPIGEVAAAQASKLAGETLDRLGDKTATPDERDSRKRRLLKGSKEFR